MKRGFTLIEIIVALMIFSIVAVVALAALVKIVDANKKAQTTQDAVVGMSFALESISRELRTAGNIRCEASSDGTVSNPRTFTTQSCGASGADGLGLGHNQLVVFKSANYDYASTPPCRLVYAYLFKTVSGITTVSKAEQTAGTNTGGFYCNETFAASSYAPILPNNVSLTDYNMQINYQSSPRIFPMGFIMLTGYAGTIEKVKTYFSVQTAITPRTP